MKKLINILIIFAFLLSSLAAYASDFPVEPGTRAHYDLYHGNKVEVKTVDASVSVTAPVVNASTVNADDVNSTGDIESDTAVIAPIVDVSDKVRPRLLRLNLLTSDPLDAQDGDIWYRDDLKKYRVRENGVNKSITAV